MSGKGEGGISDSELGFPTLETDPKSRRTSTFVYGTHELEGILFFL